MAHREIQWGSQGSEAAGKDQVLARAAGSLGLTLHRTVPRRSGTTGLADLGSPTAPVQRGSVNSGDSNSVHPYVYFS